MIDMRHMNTDLMCSASFKTAFNMRTKRWETAQQLPMRYRVTAFGGDGLAFTVIAGAADWLVNRAITFNTCSPNKRLIAPVNIMRGKHSCQAVMRRIGFGHYHRARSVFIKTVNNTRPHDPANAGKRWPAMGDQRIYQSTS